MPFRCTHRGGQRLNWSRKLTPGGDYPPGRDGSVTVGFAVPSGLYDEFHLESDGSEFSGRPACLNWRGAFERSGAEDTSPYTCIGASRVGIDPCDSQSERHFCDCWATASYGGVACRDTGGYSLSARTHAREHWSVQPPAPAAVPFTRDTAQDPGVQPGLPRDS